MTEVQRMVADESFEVDEGRIGGLSLLLRFSFTLNAALIVGVPAILKLLGKDLSKLHWLFSNIGLSVGGLLASMAGLVLIHLFVHEGETGIPISSYNIARNAGLTGLSAGSACLVLFSVGIFSADGISTWYLIIPIGIVSFSSLLGMVAELYRRHRRAEQTGR